MVNSYEKERLRNIARNQAFLKNLGVEDLKVSAIDGKGKGTAITRVRKRKIKTEPTRKSARTRHQPPPPLGSQQYEDELKAKEPSKEELLKSGALVKTDKGKGTRWCGECFGDVAQFPVGTVWGKGDFQRLGRKEMSACGFFVPFVQPEWLERHGACYSLILNNDNGSGLDKGNTFTYVGGGGRHRGQNRTAKQSFHQNWKNLTNASLKLSCELKKPVRVIRGPKLSSPFTPKDGGFRYDGLYICKRAYVEANEDGLKQCKFDFQRVKGQPPLGAETTTTTTTTTTSSGESTAKGKKSKTT